MSGRWLASKRCLAPLTVGATPGRFSLPATPAASQPGACPLFLAGENTPPAGPAPTAEEPLAVSRGNDVPVARSGCAPSETQQQRKRRSEGANAPGVQWAAAVLFHGA
ncbi:hypothetical protein BDY21DRAFT_349801 [Lineolata rhizophorae]|uniref:Uncharacterized protein n=1 Tax=Lineolata rhizophorae TaxID=578093 RepID=A0A6A6NUZ5_9PEZI|nr:hypothetical protein BDY21DRAFT_349801 [Lineolata rhizophorae]